jgi:glycosyltransferase involved in cell wall biosynthesis
MRVLHVHSGNLYGGVETILVALARHRDLAPQMQSHFALCFEGRLSEELEAAGAPVSRLGTTRLRQPVSVLQARRKLRNLLDQHDFDLSICHSGWSRTVFGPVLRSRRTPLVCWFHDANTRRHWLDRWSDRTSIELAVCNSEFTANHLRQRFPRLHTEVVYCPVTKSYGGSAEDRRALRHELQTPQAATVIVQASRMERWKGHTLLLKALDLLKDVTDWTCWLAGGSQRPQEAQYLHELKSLAAQLGISDRLRFLGQRSDIPQLLHAADIYCQPNTDPEPFGIAFIEALYARLPVVTSAIGGANEIVNDSCGLLVPPNDESALSSSLRLLIADSNRRASLGAAGPERAESLCGPQRQMEKLVEVLRPVMRGSLTG